MHMLPPLRPAVLHLPGRQRSDILTELGQLVGRQHVVHDANARGPHSCCCRAIGERSCRQDGQASGQGSRRLERLARLASPVQPDRHRRRGRTHGKAERVARCARHRATHASTAPGAKRGPYTIINLHTHRLTPYQSTTLRHAYTRLGRPLPCRLALPLRKSCAMIRRRSTVPARPPASAARLLAAARRSLGVAQLSPLPGVPRRLRARAHFSSAHSTATLHPSYRPALPLTMMLLFIWVRARLRGGVRVRARARVRVGVTTVG